MRTVLIVEDEINNVRLLKEILEDYEEKLEILIAMDGKKALTLIKDKKPKLVFLDGRIPEISGYDLCKFIKNAEELKEITVVLLTGGDMELMEDKEPFELADHVILKPFYEEKIFELLGK